MLSLHLLQISLVYVNTLMIQQVLGQDRWANAMSPDDLTICAQVRSCTAT
jgi:TnpA family transposase